ncbi:MAG: hypothetical protein J2P54_09080, partial [Bradyrhizobiaceae bacterium]|nr:hypothetical protein [Bradyrhizobiaceae bacterium]
MGLLDVEMAQLWKSGRGICQRGQIPISGAIGAYVWSPKPNRSHPRRNWFSGDRTQKPEVRLAMSIAIEFEVKIVSEFNCMKSLNPLGRAITAIKTVNVATQLLKCPPRVHDPLDAPFLLDRTGHADRLLWRVSRLLLPGKQTHTGRPDRGSLGQSRTMRSYFAEPNFWSMLSSLRIYGGTVLCIEGSSEMERIQFASR